MIENLKPESQWRQGMTIDKLIADMDQALGDFLGLTIETVSRTFSKLKAQGLIELPQSNRVRLVDVDELECLAEGDDHVC